jgi:hypothetical protein
MLNKITVTNILTSVIETLKNDSSVKTDMSYLTNLFSSDEFILKVLDMSSSKKSKKTKVEKTNKPKKPKSCYTFFANDKRKELKSSNPELNVKEIAKKLGEMWQEGKNKEENKKYYDMASNDKERYTREMISYVPSEVDKEKEEKKLKEKEEKKKEKEKKKEEQKKKKVKTERAKSAYGYFCDLFRETVTKKYPEKNMIEVNKALSEIWKTIKDTPKAEPFIKQSLEHKERLLNDKKTEKKSESKEDIVKVEDEETDKEEDNEEKDDDNEDSEEKDDEAEDDEEKEDDEEEEIRCMEF